MPVSRNDQRLKRHTRLRKKVVGTEARPRLQIFRSLHHTYAFVIDDTKGHTLVAASIFVEEPIQSHIGNSGAVISCEFAETDAQRGFVNGFNFNVARGGPAGAVGQPNRL